MRSCCEPPVIDLSRSSSALVFVLGRISPRILFSSAMYASGGGRRKRECQRVPDRLSLTQERRSSATLHAWAIQPRAREWRLGVEDFAHRSDARFVEMGGEPVERAARARDVVRIDLQPRVDVRSDEPAPHRALVVGRVARAQVAVVARLEVGIVGRQRCGGRPASATAARPVRITGSQRSGSSTGCCSEIASSWFGRHFASLPPCSASTTS